MHTEVVRQELEGKGKIFSLTVCPLTAHGSPQICVSSLAGAHLRRQGVILDRPRRDNILHEILVLLPPAQHAPALPIPPIFPPCYGHPAISPLLVSLPLHAAMSKASVASSTVIWKHTAPHASRSLLVMAGLDTFCCQNISSGGSSGA